MGDFDTIMTSFKREPVDVYVRASTLGSLEALPRARAIAAGRARPRP